MSNVEKRNWWSEFAEVMKVFGNKDVLMVITMLDNLEKDGETAEAVEEVSTKIANLQTAFNSMSTQGQNKLRKAFSTDPTGMSDAKDLRVVVIAKLIQKLKVYDNRMSRGVDESFGSLVKHLREKEGLSLAKLSELTGISPSYINRIEKGERSSPGIKIVEQLAKGLGVDKNVLLAVTTIDDTAESELPTLGELVIGHNFLYGGKKMGKKGKELLVKLLLKVEEVKWESSKHLDTVEILELVDALKSLK